MFLQARPHHIMRQGGLQHIIIWAMEAATNYNVKLHPEVISDITRERERERESASLSLKRAHMFHADYMRCTQSMTPLRRDKGFRIITTWQNELVPISLFFFCLQQPQCAICQNFLKLSHLAKQSLEQRLKSAGIICTRTKSKHALPRWSVLLRKILHCMLEQALELP